MALDCLQTLAVLEVVDEVVVVLFALRQVQFQVGNDGLLAGVGNALDALGHAVVHQRVIHTHVDVLAVAYFETHALCVNSQVLVGLRVFVGELRVMDVLPLQVIIILQNPKLLRLLRQVNNTLLVVTLVGDHVLSLDLLVHHEAFHLTLFYLVLNDILNTERLIERHTILVENYVLSVAVTLLLAVAFVTVLGCFNEFGELELLDGYFVGALKSPALKRTIVKLKV